MSDNKPQISLRESTFWWILLGCLIAGIGLTLITQYLVTDHFVPGDTKAVTDTVAYYNKRYDSLLDLNHSILLTQERREKRGDSLQRSLDTTKRVLDIQMNRTEQLAQAYLQYRANHPSGTLENSAEGWTTELGPADNTLPNPVDPGYLLAVGDTLAWEVLKQNAQIRVLEIKIDSLQGVTDSTKAAYKDLVFRQDSLLKESNGIIQFLSKKYGIVSHDYQRIKQKRFAFGPLAGLTYDGKARFFAGIGGTFILFRL